MTSTTLRARKSELSKISYRSHHGSNGGQPEGDPRAQSGSFLPLFWLCQKPWLQIRKKTLWKSRIYVLSPFNFDDTFFDDTGDVTPRQQLGAGGGVLRGGSGPRPSSIIGIEGSSVPV